MDLLCIFFKVGLEKPQYFSPQLIVFLCKVSAFRKVIDCKNPFTDILDE